MHLEKIALHIKFRMADYELLFALILLISDTSCWRNELIIHIAISVTPGTHLHLSQVEHMRVKCLAQRHKHQDNVATIDL